MKDISLIDFIHESSTIDDPTKLSNYFLRYLSKYGIDRFVMSSIAHDSIIEKQKYHGLMLNYPDEWMYHYNKNNYIDHDGIYKRAIISNKPFTWEQIKNDPSVGIKSKIILEEAKEHHLYGGIGLSIHRPFGEIIGMGLASSDNTVEINNGIVREVYAAANQMLLTYEDITVPISLSNAIKLTDREKDVLLWIARGKSRTDIAAILGIGNQTVKYHTTNIYRKLDVNSGKLAIIKAMKLGLVNPY